MNKALYQASFDKAVRHMFLVQKKPAMHGVFGCRYRTDDGAMCNLGVDIKDHYQTRMENNTPSGIASGSKGEGINALKRALRAIGYDPDNSDDLEFLINFQDAHDNTVDDFEDSDEPELSAEVWLKLYARNMKVLAHNYGLDTSVLTQLEMETL